MSVEWPRGRAALGWEALFVLMVGVVVLIGFLLWPIMAMTDPAALRKRRGHDMIER